MWSGFTFSYRRLTSRFELEEHVYTRADPAVDERESVPS